MIEQTPKPNSVRIAWTQAHPFSHTTELEERYAEFDRMIAKVKADHLVAIDLDSHFKCDCVPMDGPPHCHGCGEAFGNITMWEDRNCADAMRNKLKEVTDE